MWERFKKLPGESKALIILVILLAGSALTAWYSDDNTPTTMKFTEAPPISSIKNVPLEERKLPSGTIKVIPKEKLRKKIELPPEVISDPAKEVTAAVVAPPSETGTEIISVTDINTGVTTISTKPVEQSFMAFESKMRIGVGYGISTHGPAGKVFGEWTYARVMNAHLSVQAEINASATREPEAKAMAIVDYRWGTR